MPKKKTDPNAVAVEVPTTDRTEPQFWLALRRKMRLFYDLQELRIALQLRIAKKPATAPIELHPADLAKLTMRVTDMETAEKNALRDLEDHLNEVPFYRDVISPNRKEKWRGLGPRMASIIIASFDIKREEMVSQMWSFAGLAPVPARRCAKCYALMSEEIPGVLGTEAVLKHPKFQKSTCPHNGSIMRIVDTVASGKSMRPVAGQKLPYNSWLRAKLLGVLGPVLLQVKSPYAKFYYDYKHRWESAGKGTSDAHRHNAAIRYMIKMLLADIYAAWRSYEKLPVRPTYQEQYLNHVHHSTIPSPPDDVEQESDEEQINQEMIHDSIAD